MEIRSEGLLAMIETINLVICTINKLAEEGPEVQVKKPIEVKVDDKISKIRWEIKKVS